MNRDRDQGKRCRRPHRLFLAAGTTVVVLSASFLALAQSEEAPRSRHWSFQPVRKTPPPAVRNQPWVRNALDAFVLSRLEAEDLEPSAEADSRTLIRRVSLDLIGLPPTPREVAAFLADNRPGAYERSVDRLLASPHFGERWGRHWLDLARYGDSDGYSPDHVRPYAWRYRQWVVNALNGDLPFDQFTIEQLAGDLLPSATVEQRVATGFYRNGITNREAGVDLQLMRFDEVADRTNTVGETWLGLSVACAQCHDHKYDPISQKDFYQLFAYFNSAEDIEIDAPLAGEMKPYLQTRSEYEQRRAALLEEYRVSDLQAEWEEKMLEAGAYPGRDARWDFAWTQFGVDDFNHKIIRLAPSRRTKRQRDFLTDRFIARYSQAVNGEKYASSGFNQLSRKLGELEAEFPRLTQAQAVVQSSTPAETYVAIRGDYKNKGIAVQPATPAVLPTTPGSDSASRLDLTRWLVSDKNPLTARVFVNRIWQELFGHGLVVTSSDLGTQGQLPSHPELLDELAFDFRAGGWSVKKLIRRIVTSATYRQSSRIRPELLSRDPDNILLARQARLRLPAELVRDVTLAASGLLNPAVGGPTIRPPIPPGLTPARNPEGWWPESQGSDRYRRGIYIHFQRLTPYPQLMNFDAPDSMQTCGRRETSNTPLQALNLLNDPVFLEAARGLARRVLHESEADFQEQLTRAFEVCLSRPPSTAEVQHIHQYFQQRLRMLKQHPEQTPSLFPVQLAGVDSLRVDPAQAAAWVGVGRLLLNLDEFICRE